MPIRANGTFNFKVQDYISLIDKIAGVKDQYFVEDIKTRIISILDQLLMKWITREGKICLIFKQTLLILPREFKRT